MATDAAPAAAPRVGIWEDFIDIFYAPSAVFRRRENGNVFIPLAVVTIACGVLFYLNSGALQPMFDAEFDRSMAIAMRQNPNIPPEAVERIRSFAVRMQQVGTFIFHSSRDLRRRRDDMARRQTRRRQADLSCGDDRRRLCVRAADTRQRPAWAAGSVSRSGAARRPIPAVVRRGTISRSRYGFAAAARRSSAAWMSSRSGLRCSSPSDCA